MEQKAWIDVKSPRFFYLKGYPIYWGGGIWCENFNTSNVSQVRWLLCYLLYISDHIKRLISNGYPYHVFLNKGIRNETDVPQYLVQDPLNAIAPRIQPFCFLTPAIFKYCDGNRNKIQCSKISGYDKNGESQQSDDLI
jgi:hypothetical protein